MKPLTPSLLNYDFNRTIIYIFCLFQTLSFWFLKLQGADCLPKQFVPVNHLQILCLHSLKEVVENDLIFEKRRGDLKLHLVCVFIDFEIIDLRFLNLVNVDIKFISQVYIVAFVKTNFDSLDDQLC